ncbi:hypothetical protein ACA910_010466 [Epithemia clementina (nom. ined.)]
MTQQPPFSVSLSSSERFWNYRLGLTSSLSSYSSSTTFAGGDVWSPSPSPSALPWLSTGAIPDDHTVSLRHNKPNKHSSNYDNMKKTTRSSSSLSLGRIWQAEEAVQAWCTTIREKTKNKDKGNDDREKNEQQQEQQDDNDHGDHTHKKQDQQAPRTGLISYNPHETQRVRLLFCNRSNHPLVYSWITPHGELHGFRLLRPEQQPPSLWSPRQWITGGGGGCGISTRAASAHVERSFVGHAFVFGILPEPATAKHDPDDNDGDDDSSVDLSHVKNLKDILVLGAYRPERATVVRDEDGDEDDEDEFPTHAVILQPSPPSGCGCEGGLGWFRPKRARTEPLTSSSLIAATTTTTIHHGQSSNKDNNNADENADDAWMYYSVDPSWTIQVEPVVYDQKSNGDLLLLDTTKTKSYRRTTLGDQEWPVYIDEACFADDDDDDKNSNNNNKTNHEKWLQRLAQDLDQALQYLPRHAKRLLKAHDFEKNNDAPPCCIWINREFQYGPQSAPESCTHMCFHPGRDWLQRNRMHPQKYACVEVYCLEDYFSDCHDWGRGGVLVHELSHAYHSTCVPDGYDNAEIQACYDAAMCEGLYDCVPVHGAQGPKARAYACTNAMEYFAELSTAFLGGIDNRPDDDEYDKDRPYPKHEYNKWFPFNRRQLQEHDPRAYKMLQKIWKLDLSSSDQENDDKIETTN